VSVEFEVIGIPAPQGSKRHVGRGIMVESSKKLPPWRDAVASAARDVAADVGMLDGPLKLTVEFRLRMPASRPARVRRVGRAWHTVTPDLDKLVRSTCDALTTGGLIADDARICQLAASKVEVVDSWTGAVIAFSRLEAL